MIATLLLAAGASSRMRGGDKLLEEVDGAPLLRRQARFAAAFGPIYVALPPDRPERDAAIADLDVTRVVVANAADGMGASIAAGVAALAPKISAVIILPGDMPDLLPDALPILAASYAAQPGVIHRGATSTGKPGHPVLFPQRYFPALASLSGDQGAREVLKGQETRLCPLPGDAAVTDLDTPEAWADWRKARR